MRDGRRVVTTSFDDGETVIRDARSLRALRRLPVARQRAGSRPDDRTLLAGGRDGAVRFVDLETGRVRSPPAVTTRWSPARRSPRTAARR